MAGKTIEVREDLGEAAGGRRLARAAIVGVAPGLDRAIAFEGGEGQAIGVDLGVAGAGGRAGTARARVTPRNNGAIGPQGRKSALRGIERGEVGVRGAVAATLGRVSPYRDGAIGFERGKGSDGARDADEVISAGERFISG